MNYYIRWPQVQVWGRIEFMPPTARDLGFPQTV
jgi:hypothetical protein